MDNDIILREFGVLLKKFREREGFMNEISVMEHSGKSFYLSYNDDFFGKMKDFFSGGFPAYLSFIKEGKVHWISSFFEGYPHKEFIKIQQRKGEYIQENILKMKEDEKKVDIWIKKNKISFGNNISYYLEKVRSSYSLLLNTLKHFELCIFINPFLEKELSQLFDNYGISAETYLKLAVSIKKSSAKIHEENINTFLRICKKEGIRYKEAKYKDITQKRNVKQALIKCYVSGYFLHASIGGVEIWDIEKELKEIQRYPHFKFKNQENKNIFNLNQKQKIWLKIANHFSEQRDRRKTLQQKLFYYQAECLNEISKIIKISREDLENLKPEQFTKELFDKRDLVLETIKKQKKGHLFIHSEKKGFFIEFGERAEEIFNQIHSQFKIKDKFKEIKGNVACKGYARGKARVILSMFNQFVFNKGDILVAGMTYPDFVPLIKKAAAIITNDGGITCHAAILAREFNIPCIIGTKIATQVIKTGDIIEVDANKGIIRRIQEKID